MRGRDWRKMSAGVGFHTSSDGDRGGVVLGYVHGTIRQKLCIIFCVVGLLLKRVALTDATGRGFRSCEYEALVSWHRRGIVEIDCGFL